MNSTRRLWTLIDVLLVAAALAVGVRLTTSYLSRRPLDPPPPPLLVATGEVLAVPSVEWHLAERNVVLRARTTCDACNRSVEFFREISRCTQGLPSATLTVLTDEPLERMNQWLAANSIVVDRVVQTEEPYRLGFLVIPTLLITDRTGRVSDVLLGEAAASQQTHFISRLPSGSTAPPLDNAGYAEEIDAATLAKRQQERKVTVLDIRRRQEFAAGHWPGAINIPQDEIPARASQELTAATEIALDCTRLDSVPCRATALDIRGLRRVPVAIVFR